MPAPTVVPATNAAAPATLLVAGGSDCGAGADAGRGRTARPSSGGLALMVSGARGAVHAWRWRAASRGSALPTANAGLRRTAPAPRQSSEARAHRIPDFGFYQNLRSQ